MVGLSAGASFAASLVLAGLGAAAIGRGASRERRMFAAIPLLFAAQHAAEAAVWLTGGAPLLRCLAVGLFLGIGVVVWPIWLPLSLGLIEGSRPRQWALGAAARFGAVVATCAAALLLRWQPSAYLAGGGVIYEGLPGQSLADAVICVLAYLMGGDRSALPVDRARDAGDGPDVGGGADRGGRRAGDGPNHRLVSLHAPAERPDRAGRVAAAAWSEPPRGADVRDRRDLLSAARGCGRRRRAEPPGS